MSESSQAEPGREVPGPAGWRETQDPARPGFRGSRSHEPDPLLSSSFQTLFDARSSDDVVAVAEAEGRLQRALVIPEVVETLAQTLELCGQGGVVTLRPGVPQLGPPLAGLLDFLVNIGQGHVVFNEVRVSLIPGGR